jgi:hypothetical protein
MTYRFYTLRQRPQLRSQFDRMHALAWPPFLQGDPVNALWPSLYTDFPDYQIGLCDRSGDVVAIGNTIPFLWNGRPSGLPARVFDVIARGIKAVATGRQPDTLAALAAIVDPARRKKGLSAQMVLAMRDLAATHGFKALVVPVRPSHKAQYPLIPMASYVTWKRPDGAPFDPWLRVHWRLGGRVLKITPRGNTVDATVADWQRWTGLEFPASGRYIVSGAFQPIVLRRRRERVRYEEANVWVLHNTAASTPRLKE